MSLESPLKGKWIQLVLVMFLWYCIYWILWAHSLGDASDKDIDIGYYSKPNIINAYIFVHTHTHTHTHKYIYTYMHNIYILCIYYVYIILDELVQSSRCDSPGSVTPLSAVVRCIMGQFRGGLSKLNLKSK